MQRLRSTPSHFARLQAADTGNLKRGTIEADTETLRRARLLADILSFDYVRHIN